MSWDRVEAAVKAAGSAYSAMMSAREDERGGSNAVKMAESVWHDALNERAAALEEQWDEEKDGFAIHEPEAPSLARVLQRYYAEMLPVWKAQKEAAAAAAKAKKKEEEDGSS